MYLSSMIDHIQYGDTPLQLVERLATQAVQLGSLDDNSGNLGGSKTNVEVGVFKAALAALEMLHLSGPLTDQAKKTLDELGDMNENLKRRENSPNAVLSSQLNKVQNDGAVLQALLADLDVALNSEDIESNTADGNETA